VPLPPDKITGIISRIVVDIFMKIKDYKLPKT
jgi:hypothetical protein